MTTQPVGGNQNQGGCKRLFVHARWRPLRRAETKRRNRNGEQEEESRHEKIITDEKNDTVAEEKNGQEDSGQEDSEEACRRQGVQTGLEEEEIRKIKQKHGVK